MNKLTVIIFLVGVYLANAGNTREIIAQVGDMTSVLGPAGKNICVGGDGSNIAIIYGSPSDPYDPNHPFSAVFVASSTNHGSSWSMFGPFSQHAPLSQIFPGIDGITDFFYVWQEDNYGIYTMTCFDPLTNSPGCGMPCIGVNSDNPNNIMITGSNYAWISTDGGNIWSDTIRIKDSGNAGHFRWGTGNYTFLTYLDSIPYYIETTDGGYTWSYPATLPAITSNNFSWIGLDCEVINNLPFSAHDDVDMAGVMQLFYPNPDNPGSPGNWNWTALNVDSIGTGSCVYHDTTWTTSIIQYPSVSYDQSCNVILLTYKCDYSINPAPTGWTDGIYLGGILSTDGGRTWYPTRPLSGLFGQMCSATETAHRLATINDTTYAYMTWTDAGDGAPGNQYFELGTVMAIQDTIFGPGYGIKENENRAVSVTKLTVSPTLVSNACCVSLNIPQSGITSIKLFDAAGRLAKTVSDGHLNRGQHYFDLNTSQLPNGIYLLVLNSAVTQETAKFIKVH